MDDIQFELKNLEFHLRQTAKNYDKCISKAIKQFMETDKESHILFKPCESLKMNLDNLVKHYEEATQKKFSS